MAIEIVYPNPFAGLAAFVGGATTAYNQGRIQSQTQEAQWQYTENQRQRAQNAQYGAMIGSSLGTIGLAATLPHTPGFQQTANMYGQDAAMAGMRQALMPAQYAALGAYMGAPYQQAVDRVGQQQAADIRLDAQTRYFDHTNAADRENFDYTRAARNEDRFIENFGATPAQAESAGEMSYQQAPPQMRAQIAQQFGYTPQQVDALPAPQRRAFFGSVGTQQLRQAQFTEQLGEKMMINAAQGAMQQADQVLQGIEGGQIQLIGNAANEYAKLRNSGNTGAPMTPSQRATFIAQNRRDMQNFAGRLQQGTDYIPRQTPTIKEQAQELILETPDGQTYTVDVDPKSGKPRSVRPVKKEQPEVSFKNEQERDAHFKLNNKIENGVPYSWDGKQWKPSSVKPQQDEVPQIKPLSQKEIADRNANFWKMVAAGKRRTVESSDAATGEKKVQTVIEDYTPAEIKQMKREIFEEPQRAAMEQAQWSTQFTEMYRDRETAVKEARRVQKVLKEVPPQFWQQMNIPQDHIAQMSAMAEEVIRTGGGRASIRMGGDGGGEWNQSLENELNALKSRYSDPSQVPPAERARAQELIRMKNAATR